MKKYIKIVICALLFSMLIWLFYPRSLVQKMGKADDIALTFGGGFSGKERVGWYIPQGSRDYEELESILKKYRYHITWRTLLRYNTITGPMDEDVTIRMDNEKQGEVFYLHSTGRKETFIGGDVYNIGYFGDDRAMKLMKEIKNFIYSRQKAITERESGGS